MDKIAHLTEYGVLGFLVARATSPAVGTWAFLASLLVGALVGGLDENYQRLVPGREVDIFDFLADTTGATLGGLIHGWWRRRRRPPADVHRSS